MPPKLRLPGVGVEDEFDFDAASDNVTYTGENVSVSATVQGTLVLQRGEDAPALSALSILAMLKPMSACRPEHGCWQISARGKR